MQLEAVLCGLYAAVGFALGSVRALWGLMALLGFVAVTSSLGWQLGLPNAATPQAYTFGLVLGFGLSSAIGAGGLAAARRQLRAHPNIALALAFTAIAVTTASLLAALRSSGFDTSAIDATGLADAAFGYHKPPGTAASLQSLWVALMGPAVFVIALSTTERKNDRAHVVSAFLCGVGIAVTAPLLQLVFGDPWVRPDLELSESFGIVSWFQDQNSFGAYLIVGLGVSLGLAVGLIGDGDRKRAGLLLLLGGASLVCIVMTNSRSAVVAAAMTLAVLVATARPSPATRRRAKRQFALAGIALALVVMTIASLLLSPALRSLVIGASGDDAPRLLEPLETSSGLARLVELRSYHYQKGSELIRQRPLWGVGPHGYFGAEVAIVRADGSPADPALVRENGHNYFMQFGAEFGLPAMFALIAALAMMVVATTRRALFTPDHVSRGFAAGLLAAQVGFLAISLVSHPMLLAELQAVFWTLSGAALTIPAQETEAG